MERTLESRRRADGSASSPAEVAGGGDPVVLTKRGRALAVLVDREQYA